MQIMCLNAWGGKLHDRIVPYVQSVDPDVLCLQEVVHTPAAHEDWLVYRDGDHVLDQYARFFEGLSAALPEHTATFCPAACGTLWNGDTPVPSYFGLATFVRKSLPVVGQVQGFVHKSFSADGYGEHPRSRPAHGVRVFDDARGVFVSILHMHGLRDLAGKMDTPERALQAKRFAQMARDLSEAGDELVLCGDFNVMPESETLRILSELGLVELVTTRGFEGTRNSLYQKPARFADYMLVSETLQHAGFDVIYDPEVSDHCPLILNVL